MHFFLGRGFLARLALPRLFLDDAQFSSASSAPWLNVTFFGSDPKGASSTLAYASRNFPNLHMQTRYSPAS